MTGAEPDTDSEDEEGAGASGRDGEDGAHVKVHTVLVIYFKDFVGLAAGVTLIFY